MAKKAHEEMLAISGHEGTANQTTLIFHITLLEYPSSKTPRTPDVGEDVGKKKPL
jgi:hypothetical protein